MKNKLLLLSTVFTSLISCNQLVADNMNPNMPTGGNRPCYPSTKCTGDPNLIGGSRSGGCSGNMNSSGNSYGSTQGSTYSSNNPGYGAPTGKLLQTDSSEKFTGTIKSINRVSLPNQVQIQIVLSTERGDIQVIVGPASYIDQQKIMFKVGDKVEVTGYRIKANGEEVITAAQIKKNGSTLQLLNEKRQPMWGSHHY